tara:strand:+ start:127 stop:507 length:381 start_codon:yes stop_codon:yes gene_type:complete
MARKSFKMALSDESKEQLVDRFREFIDKVKDGRYIITIEKQQRERSGEQNKFYWAILHQIQDQTGQISEELHEIFKAKYLVDRSARLPRIKSTSELSVIEFNEYITKICADMGELGIILNFPEDRH